MKIRVYVLQKLYSCRTWVLYIGISFGIVLFSIVILIFLGKLNQKKLIIEENVNQKVSWILPKHSVQSDINNVQYLKVNLPQSYFDKPFGDTKYSSNSNRQLSVYTILEIEGDKITLKPYNKWQKNSSNLLFISVTSVNEIEKQFQSRNKNFIVGYQLNRPHFETDHLLVQLFGTDLMLLQPKNFGNSKYDPFYIKIARGENPRSNDMFRDSFSIVTMIKNRQYKVKYNVSFSNDFIKLIRRGSPYKSEEATNALERLFILTSSSNSNQILQLTEKDLEVFVKINNEVAGLIDKNSVVEPIVH